VQNINRILSLVIGIIWVFSHPTEAAYKRIVIVGDSLTSGYQIPQDKTFPSLLNARLSKEKWQVINAGIKGDTTAGGLSRIDWILKGKPEIVVVALGTNDGKRRFSAWGIQRNLEKMVSQIQESGSTAVIIAMPLPAQAPQEYKIKFSKIFKNVSLRCFCQWIPPLFDEIAANPEMHLSDGLHLNIKGHQEMANRLYPLLVPTIQKRERGEL
jgi:acyl-CoA thioesterase-1